MISAEEIKECLKFRWDYIDDDGNYPFRGNYSDIVQDGTKIRWPLWGCELVLDCKDGTWFVNDTSGG